MKKIRCLISIWICKILIVVGKALGKKGSSTPGSIAFKICPDILEILSKQVRKETIAVCGTNGKTTTNNIVSFILERSGYKVVCNKVGANMLPGVITAFIEKSNIFGKLDADYACIEIDEASAVKVFRYLSPDIMLIGNLFRDQLDRYGEIDLTVNYLKRALDLTPKTKLIVNADDPLCAMIAKDYKGESITFGINEQLNISLDEIRDGQFCTYCGEKLTYNYYHYGQLGDYYCKGCGFKRPDIDIEATNVDIKDGLKFRVDEHQINVNYRGFYNVYNILAALSIIEQLDIDIDNINDILEDYKPQIGRMEKFNLQKPVILNLSKNPAGFNQGIVTVLADDKEKDVIVMINDNAQDGRDISWIWDVDFEKIQDDKIKNLAFTGIRKDDVAVRFKYADINKGNYVYDNLKDAITSMLEKDGEILYVLVNYTAIFDAKNILKELQKKFEEESLNEN